jgi:hypothetical protein
MLHQQVISSPKLAKILQKLLIIGRVVIMEATSGANNNPHNNAIKAKLNQLNKNKGQASNDKNGKVSILDQLIIISSTKGMP